MGTKGARLTTEISLPGRFVVYTPFGDGIGVSRRLEDDERERLKAICKRLELPEGGIIVRTAAEGASEEELAGDLAFLAEALGHDPGPRATRSKAPVARLPRGRAAAARRPRPLPARLRAPRRSTTSATYRRIVSYLKRTSPELAEQGRVVPGRRAADGAIRRRGGGPLDAPPPRRPAVGRLPRSSTTPRRSRSSTSTPGASSAREARAPAARLEDTITKNNLEAAKEIVRQLRLRDIGGIIVIDFIDMANPKNRHEVEEALKLELERDRTKTYVVEISPLGLVEMTRQNVTDGPREILTTRCPICEGDGIVVSEETYAVDAERRLRQLAAASKAEAFLVELPSRVAGILIGPAGARLAEIERETGQAVRVRDARTISRRTTSPCWPRARPTRSSRRRCPSLPGEELEVQLEEVHLRAPRGCDRAARRLRRRGRGRRGQGREDDAACGSSGRRGRSAYAALAGAAPRQRRPSRPASWPRRTRQPPRHGRAHAGPDSARLRHPPRLLPWRQPPWKPRALPRSRVRRGAHGPRLRRPQRRRRWRRPQETKALPQSRGRGAAGSARPRRAPQPGWPRSGGRRAGRGGGRRPRPPARTGRRRRRRRAGARAEAAAGRSPPSRAPPKGPRRPRSSSPSRASPSPDPGTPSSRRRPRSETRRTGRSGRSVDTPRLTRRARPQEADGARGRGDLGRAGRGSGNGGGRSAACGRGRRGRAGVGAAADAGDGTPKKRTRRGTRGGRGRRRRRRPTARWRT